MARMSKTDHWGPIAAAVVLAGYLGFCFSTLRTTAPTFDEVAHLPAGYVSLADPTMLLNPEHPPLAKKLAALPLLAQVPVSESLRQAWSHLDEWQFGRLFLFHTGHDPQYLMALGRTPMIALGLLLCMIVLLWSHRLHGWPAAITSLVLCAGSPTILAHARLVTTDVPVAAFGTLAAFLAWHAFERPRLATSAAAGVAAGAAMASKFTGVLYLPALAVAALAAWRKKRKQTTAGLPPLRPLLGHLALFLAAAVLVVAGSYGWPPRLGTYLQGFTRIGFNHTPGYEFYLLGRFNASGFTTYFPLALLLKSSPVFLTLLPAWFLTTATRRLRRPAGEEPPTTPVATAGPFLWTPALVHGAFITGTAPDIGVRYMIPVLPFLFILAGSVGAVFWTSRTGKLGLVLVTAGQCLVAWQAWPDPISYFNGLAGCRGTGAIACLDDSNLDWGQDLVNIADVVAPLRTPGNPLRLLYFGTADPRAYLHEWRAMKPEEMRRPRPALYVVSLHRLNRLIHETGIDWLQVHQPVTTVGNTYLVFDFRDRDTSFTSGSRADTIKQ